MTYPCTRVCTPRSECDSVAMDGSCLDVDAPQNGLCLLYDMDTEIRRCCQKSCDMSFASVQLLMGRLQLGFLFPRSGPVSSAVGVQMGLAYFRSRGKSDLFPVQQSHAILFTGGVFGQLSFRLSKHIHIPLTLGVGALPRGIAVRFAKKTQATLHTLLIEGNLGVAIRF